MFLLGQIFPSFLTWRRFPFKSRGGVCGDTEDSVYSTQGTPHTLELTLAESFGETEAVSGSSGQFWDALWSTDSSSLQVEMSQQVHKGSPRLQNILPPT